MISNSFKKPIILLLASSMLLGCSSKTSIKPKQAMQILDMIIYEQSKEETSISRGSEINIEYKQTEGEDTTIKCLYELSEKNKIIHLIDPDKVQTETWYYLESSALYYCYRDSSGNIATILEEDDPDIAIASFSQYFLDYKLVANKKINEVDKPSEIKEFIASLDEVDQYKMKAKYQTKKDYSLKADIKVYEDYNHKKQLKSFQFEYLDSKLISYKYQELDGVIDEYNINYTNSVTRDSIK